MTTETPSKVPHCLACGKPLTYDMWVQNDCPADVSPGGVVGHNPSIAGGLLPSELIKEEKA